jgi:transcriptional regulator with XRE-family HTH domain
MAIGGRIKLFRNKKNMTQKQLGKILGFLGRTSDVRIAQYENEARIPKQDLVKKMAQVLEVSPFALTVPDIDTYIGLIHTLFALEDTYGLTIGKLDGEVCLHLDKASGSVNSSLFQMLLEWYEQADRLKNEEITKDEYDQWRYRYPELTTSHQWGRVPSNRINNYMTNS